MSTAQLAQQWTVLSLLEWGSSYLSGKGFDEARLTVDLLLAHVLHVKRLDLYLQFDRPLTADELAGFKQLFRRRLGHEPLQYILGETEFMGLAITVNSSVLIPRPETELLAERALEACAAMTVPSLRILDVGTGSGNIAVVLGSRLPQAQIVAIDTSALALETARENIARHGLRNVEIDQVDIFGEGLGNRRFHLIVSNPPYVSRSEFEALQPEIRDFEPRIATTDDGDGLSFYRRIVGLSDSLLFPGGALMFEVGHGQSEAVSGLMRAAGLSRREWFQDDAGILRVVRGWMGGPATEGA